MLQQISAPVAFLPAARLPKGPMAYQVGQLHAAVVPSSISEDRFQLLFSGKTKKKEKAPQKSTEEIEHLKFLENRAPQIREALPISLKLWSPLPQQHIVRNGHIDKFVAALENSTTACRSETLQKGVRALVDQVDSYAEMSPLHQAETEFLEGLNRIQESLTVKGLNATILLTALPPGPLKDASIAYILQHHSLLYGEVQQAVAQDLQQVQNPMLRAALETMVRHSPELKLPEPSQQDGHEGGHAQPQSALVKHLESYVYYHSSAYELFKKLYASQPPLSDDAKRALILSAFNAKHTRSSYSVDVPILAAAATLQNAEKRDALVDELWNMQPHYWQEGMQLAHSIHAPVKIAALDEKTKLPSLMMEGLRPFVTRGFSLLDVPDLVSSLEKTGQDAGALVSTILPAYDEVLDFALKHPDKLVKTGNKPPTEDEIRARFLKQGVLIMQALIVTGVPALKSAIHRKRLDNFLDMMPSVLQHPNFLKPIHQLSKMTEKPVDNYKLLPYIASFSKIDKENDLKKLMAEMIQNKKLDTKVIAKAYLTMVFSNSYLKGVKIADDQVEKWDPDHIDTLVAALNSWEGHKLEELIALSASALEGRFHSFLHDPATPVGKNNLETRKAFETLFQKQGLKLDYQQWLHFPGEVRVNHPSKIDERQSIIHAANSLFGEMQATYPALWPQVKEHLMHFGLPLVNGELQRWAPKEPWDKEARYDDDLRTVLQSSAFKKEPSWQARANYLSKRIDNLKYAPVKSQQLKIKLWERSPGTDLFHGNYTGACIALDSFGDNSYAVVQANQNTLVQVAYLYDSANKIVGKGLFFWAKNLKTNEPILVLNTFEGRANGSRGYEENIHVRDGYAEFARQYSRAVLGYVAPIYTGTQLNPLYRDDLQDAPINMEVIGSALHNQYYLDSLPDDGNQINTQHTPNNRLQLLYPGESRQKSRNLFSSKSSGLEKDYTYREEQEAQSDIEEPMAQSPFTLEENQPALQEQGRKNTSTSSLQKFLDVLPFSGGTPAAEASGEAAENMPTGNEVIKKMFQLWKDKTNN